MPQPLLSREADIYLCMRHYNNPAECPKTHRVYASITELTPEILDDVIERIEIGHVTAKSKPGKVIQIYWKLK